MSFFKSLYKSLYDIRWLHEQRDKTKQALIFFFLFTFLLTGLLLIPVFVEVYPKVGKLGGEIMSQVPNFTAEVVNDKLKITELKQPYIFKDKNFILVVDTVTTTELSIKNYLGNGIESGLLLTADKLETYQGKTGQQRTKFFSTARETKKDNTLDSAIFTRDDLAKLVDKFFSWRFVIPVSILIFLLVYIFECIALFFTCLISTIIVLIINSIAKKDWSFPNIYIVALQSITLPALVNYTLMSFDLRVRFIFIITLVVMLLLVIYKGGKAENTENTIIGA